MTKQSGLIEAIADMGFEVRGKKSRGDWEMINSSSEADPNAGPYCGVKIRNYATNRTVTFDFTIYSQGRMWVYHAKSCLNIFDYLIHLVTLAGRSWTIANVTHDQLMYVFGEDGFPELLHAMVKCKINSSQPIHSRKCFYSWLCKIPETSLKTIKFILSEEHEDLSEYLLNHSTAKELVAFR